MAEIIVKEFSCIDEAKLDIKKLNIIIGPQGSGKSVITKLIYFFNEIIPEMLSSIEDQFTLSEFKKNIERSFSSWFPPQAWGDKRFLITYTDGDFNARVLRRMRAGSLSDEVSVKISPWLEDLYAESIDVVEAYFSEDNDIEYNEELYGSMRIYNRIRIRILNRMIMKNKHPVMYQTFIPAGRAFFTSIGRIVAGIENAGNLDPATLKFAKLFANWRDSTSGMRKRLKKPESILKYKEIMDSLFDGVVQTKRGTEYIEMNDGRKVPFSSLSSGQQELLPIWYFLENTIYKDDRLKYTTDRSSDRTAVKLHRYSEHVYVEEPEAHLFPRAQCQLIEILISTVFSSATNRRMIITTHSPYIMSRLNVLLKAGEISRTRKRNSDLRKIVPEDRWIRLRDFSASKIESGKIFSLIDFEEGLIDAEFLDSVSDVISEDFARLLDLEDES